MIQALAAAILVPLALISGVLGAQSVRDHLAFRDLDQGLAQSPENLNSQHDTNPADVRLPDFFPAPSAAGAPTTSVVGSTQPPSNASASSGSLPPPTGAVLGETDTQPVVERVIETVRTVIEGGLTAADVDARMLALRQSLEAQINTVAAKTDTKSETIYQTLGMVARIENLRNVNLTDITVSGVTGLTDADIPDAITASNYLPLTGGSISGDLTLSGTLTAGSLSVAALSSGGAIEGPYVNATSSTATSTFAGGITGPGNFVVQSSSGRVGIGTITPDFPLHIVTNGSGYIQTDSYRNSAFGGGLAIQHARGTSAAPSALSSGDRAGTIYFAGYDGGAFNNTAAIHSEMDGTPVGNSSSPGRLLFSTTPANSVAEVERMRITSAGNIGIGTTTPGQKLSVAGDILGNNFIGSHFTATSTTATTTLAGGITGPGNFAVQSSSGRVGIGTTSPYAPLSVQTGGVIDAVFALTRLNSGARSEIRFSNSVDNGAFGIGLTVGTNTFIIRDINDNTTPVTIEDTAGDNLLRLSRFMGGSVVGGGVGISTTSPWAKLSVTNTSAAPSFVVEDSTSPDTTPFIIDASGNVGIGTTSPTNMLHISGSSPVIRLQDTDSGAASYMEFWGPTTQVGYVGDGSGSDDNIYLLSIAGNIGIQGTGGSCTFTGAASGGSCFSDASLKNVVGNVSDVLNGVTTLNLAEFYWNDLAHSVTNASTTIKNTGFLAQDVGRAFPELVHTDESGFKTLDYGTLGMYGLVAIKELNLKLEDLATTTDDIEESSFTSRFFISLFARLTQWFADAGNGIGEIFARVFRAKDALCINDTCVNEDQLKSLLGRVSRAWPVHTVARNCTRDEGRPFGFGDQVADPKPP